MLLAALSLMVMVSIHLERSWSPAPSLSCLPKDGHYANKCPDLASFSNHAPSFDANLALAFNAKCHVTDDARDWYVDYDATPHMMPSFSSLDSAPNYSMFHLMLRWALCARAGSMGFLTKAKFNTLEGIL
ncbi:hypothetical protein Tco_0565747 [Tanacetum coccineum]